MTYQIKITSKNPRSIKFLFLFCFQNKNFNIETTCFKIKNKKKIITILKSPHVNKTAQSQIEYRIFSANIKVFSCNISPFLVWIKRIRSQLFPETKIKTSIIIDKQNELNMQTKTINPKKFFINSISQSNKKKTLAYIKIFDCFGELNLRKNIY